MSKSVREEVKEVVKAEARKRFHFNVGLFPEDEEPGSQEVAEVIGSVIVPLARMAESVQVELPPEKNGFGERFQAILQKEGRVNYLKPDALSNELVADFIRSDSVNPVRGSLVCQLKGGDLLDRIPFSRFCDPTIVTNVGSVIGKSVASKIKGRVREAPDLAFVVFDPFGIRGATIFAGSENIERLLRMAYKKCQFSPGFLNLYGE